MQDKSSPFLCVICVQKWLDNIFTPEQRTFMVLSYHQTGSPSQTRQAFAERFSKRRPPDKRTIVRNFQKYQRHATSHNRNKSNSSFNRIVKFDLKFHPFRMIIRHQLFHSDLQRRINRAETKALIGGGGGCIFIYSRSARRISFEINCNDN